MSLHCSPDYLPDCPPDSDLRRYVVGDLPDLPIERFEQHIADCETCVERLNTLSSSSHSWLRIAQSVPSNPFQGSSIPWATPEIGDRIGDYLIQERIGSGGVGNVYRCLHPRLGHSVAVKVLKPELHSRSNINRFLVECQSLTRMQHPNIAAVLDSGNFHGSAFLVMELLEGKTICAYCNAKKLDVPSRIRLLVQVCDGIQHAHQKGIIHRDIKPSNLIVVEVNGSPVPKVIDFGIARTMDSTIPDCTEPGTLIGTPAYMSPEQASLNSQAVDTRSDLFSLGTVLFELLTGSTPFAEGDTKLTVLETLQQVRFAETPKLTNRVNTSTSLDLAASRSTTIRLLRSELHGELQWIVERALQKDPADRYATVVDFARDLNAYCHGQAVQAGPPSRLYRFRKALIRNRVAFAFAILAFSVLAACAIGFVLVSNSLVRENAALVRENAALDNERQAKRLADDRYRQTRNAVDQFYLQVAENELLQSDRFLALRKKLLTQALEYYREFVEQKLEDTSLLADMENAQTRVAHILQIIGEYDESAVQSERALDLNDRSRERVGPTRANQLARAILLMRLGSIHRLAKRLEDGKKWASSSVEVLDSLYQSIETSDINEAIEIRTQLASALTILASIHRVSHGFAEAEEALQRALALRREVLSVKPGDVGSMRNLARVLGDYANLLQTLDRNQDALAVHDQSIAMFSELLKLNPLSVLDLLGLAKSNGNLAGLYHRIQDLPRALASGEQGTRYFQRVVEQEPWNADYRENLSRAYRFYAFLHAKAGNDFEAEKSLISFANEIKTLTNTLSESFRHRRELAKAQLEQGKFYSARQRWDEAISAYQESRSLYMQTIAHDANDGTAKLYLLRCIRYEQEAEKNVGNTQAIDALQELEMEWLAKIETEVPDREMKMQMMDMEDQFYAALFSPNNKPTSE